MLLMLLLLLLLLVIASCTCCFWVVPILETVVLQQLSRIKGIAHPLAALICPLESAPAHTFVAA